MYQAASTPMQLSEVITLTTKIAELKQKLQEAQFQKRQTTLEKKAAVQEVEAKKKVKMLLHRRLGKVVLKSTYPLHTNLQ